MKIRTETFIRLLDFVKQFPHYTIGSNADIQATYEKMLTWASDHGFTLQGNAFERQVLDIYSVSDENKYVTEILLPVAGDYSDVGKSSNWLMP